jgi:hypothetical protein
VWPMSIEEGGNRRSYDVEIHEYRHGGSSGRDQCALVAVTMYAQVDLLPPLCVLQDQSEKALSVFAFDVVSLFCCSTLISSSSGRGLYAP